MAFDFSTAIGALSPIASGLLTGYGQRKTNQSIIDESQKNRDWQERMSNTSYQRAMHDMRAAGLNPMLAFMKGGASTPSGSSATGMQNELGVSANSAMEMRRMTLEAEKIRSDVALNRAMARSFDAGAVKSAIEAKNLGFTRPGILQKITDAIVNTSSFKIKQGPMDADRPGDRRYVFGKVRVRKKGDN